MSTKWIYIMLTLWTSSLGAQDMTFKVEISSDTIFMGNALGIKYTIENSQGEFRAPDFAGFDIVSGPNVSSQFSMINGEVSQSASYSYVLVPTLIGILSIDPGALVGSESEILTAPLSITVVDNPDQVWQDYRVYKKAEQTLAPADILMISKQDSLKQKIKKLKTKKI